MPAPTNAFLTELAQIPTDTLETVMAAKGGATLYLQPWFQEEISNKLI